jgi:CubicO group peptidase (beta-lactamase class C family)
MRTLIAAFWVVCAVGTAQPKPGLDSIDSFVEKALADFQVPGVAIAIVRNDDIVLSKGYGLRNLKEKLPVTPKTLFAIGSSTKSFTVMSVGVLADQGRIDWDKPVREYLPNFRLFDQTATEKMTPRDLVTHRSGLPRHDLMWYNSPLKRKDIFERLRYLEPNRDFRSTWQYQNLMYMTAGYLAGQVADMPWETLVRERIFKPLGMTSSNFSVNDSQKTGDYALPYSRIKEEVQAVPFRNIDEIGPAGSINSNIEDMIRYVRMHLNKGKYESTQVASEALVRDMQTPQMVIPAVPRHRELGHDSYGMGFFVTSYRGHKLVHHGGNIDGFSALVTFMPQDNIGMVILANMNGSPLPSMLSYQVYDRLLGMEPVDWTARIKDDERRAKQSEEEAKKRGITPQRPNTRPSHDLAEYAGEYEHPGYGVMKVGLENGELSAKFNGFTGSLKHFHYDVFEVAQADMNPLSKSKIQFHSNVQGDVDRLTAPVETNVKEISFARLPDRQMSERSFLEPLTGKYALGPQQVSFEIRADGVMTIVLPGRPPAELEGVRGTRFNVKGRAGFSVEFRKDTDGRWNEVVFFQPNGTFVAKRQ